MQLKFLSWNIWGGRHIDDVIDFLKSADADIIALQEVIREGDGNTALTIAQRLGYEISPISPAVALTMPISSKWTGPVKEKEEIYTFGNAILTKHKIASSRAYELSSGESRVAISADVLVGDFLFHVFSIHLKHIHVSNDNEPEVVAMHRGQADKLMTLLPKEKTIVAGDFNTVANGYAVQKANEFLRDSEQGSATPTWSVYPEGCGVCPFTGIAYKFDYIFTSKDLKTNGFQVGDSKGSDHLPVSVMIEI